MVAGKSPDWLPSGWTMEVEVQKGRKVKLYSNVETGQKLYSKKDVIHYVEAGSGCHGTRQPMIEQNKRHPGNKIMPIVASTNDPPEWLPHGWITELKTRKGGSRTGSSYKCYIDPATGCKFYSKPQVFQYLKTVGHNNGSVKQKKRDIDCLTGEKSPLTLDVSQNHRTVKDKSCTSERKEIGTEKHSVNNVMVQGVSPDELPPGWIKEIKIREDLTGTRKDSYFTDPVSGYTFRSKKDVLRYLETGDISSCIMRPKKKKANGLDLKNDENSSPSAVDTKRSTHRTTRRLPFSGKESYDRSSSVVPEASSKRRKRNSLSTNAAIASSSAAEILEEKPLDDVNEKCAEMKESSDAKPRDSEGKEMEVLGNGSISTPATDILQEQKLPEASSKNRKCNSTSTNAAVASSSAAEILEEKPLVDVNGKCAETKESSDSKPRDSEGKEITGNGSISTPATDFLQEQKLPEASSKKRKCNSISTIAAVASSSAAEILEEKPLVDVIEKCAEMKESSDSKPRDSEGKEIAVLGNGSISTPAADILQEQKLPVKTMEKHSNREKPATSKSKKKRELSLPIRSSKRLARQEPDILGNSGLSERTIRATARNSVEIEANLSASSAARNFGEIEANLSASSAARNSGEEANLSTGSASRNSGDIEANLSMGSAARDSGEIEANLSTGLTARDSGEIEANLSTGSAARDSGDIEANLSTGLAARDSGDIEANLSTSSAVRDSGEIEANLSSGLAAKNSGEIEGEANLSTGLAAINSGEIEGEANLSTGLAAINSGEIEATLCAGLMARNSGEIEAGLAASNSAEIEVGLAATNSGESEANLSACLTARNSGELEAELSTGLAARNCGEIEANLSAGLVLEAALHRTNQQVEAEQTLEISHHASIDIEALLEEEPSNESEKPSEDQAVSEEQPTEKQVIEPLQSQDPQTFYPFGDSWSDPCLEFAFKTLTGAIPFEEDLAIHAYFQQQVDTSHPQRDGSQAEFGLSSFFQNDTSSHFDSPNKNTSIQQLPGSSTFLPPGSIGLPGCSGTASQQPSLESANMKQRSVSQDDQLFYPENDCKVPW